MVKSIVCMILAFVLASNVRAEGGGHKEAKGVSNELKFEELIVPVLMREDVQGYYSLSLTITPKDETKSEELAKFGPRIKDAILHDLFVILPVIWSNDQQPSIDVMKKRLEMVAKKTTPENTVGEVVVNGFQVTDMKDKKTEIRK